MRSYSLQAIIRHILLINMKNFMNKCNIIDNKQFFAIMKNLHTEKYHPTNNESTIAEMNKVSIKQLNNNYQYNPNVPFRIRLPEYFNIPAFTDLSMEDLLSRGANHNLSANTEQQSGELKETDNGDVNEKKIVIVKEDAIFKKRMKDLSLLAEGMKRAKNIKEESRYYFTQGVLLNNIGLYIKSIEYFEKFIKIVLYLQDQKSVELALNVIGCAYMASGDYLKAIEFHTRQAQVSPRADRFLSFVNIGLCHELLGNPKEAYSLYQAAETTLETMEENDEKVARQTGLEKVLERVEMKIRESDLFMTENPTKSKSPNKSIKNSILKEESSLLLKRTSNRKEYDRNKVKYAIHAAQENIEEHIKSSMIYQA